MGPKEHETDPSNVAGSTGEARMSEEMTGVMTAEVVKEK